MANTKSAKAKVREITKKTDINKSVRNRYRTFIKKVELNISNMAFGGSNIHEIVEAFNFLKKHKLPKRIYIGINFHNYNEAFSHNRINRLSMFVENPIYYLLSKDLFYDLVFLFKINFYFVQS